MPRVEVNMNRFYIWRYLRRWVIYTPFFFCNAPLWKWHCYFASSHRISSGFAWYEGEIRKAETISELQQLDNQVLFVLAQGQEEIEFRQRNPTYKR